jgi:hypothetical protein
MGQKQTSRRLRIMSAIPPKADIAGRRRHVRFVPKADIRAMRQPTSRPIELCSGLRHFPPAYTLVTADHVAGSVLPRLQFALIASGMVGSFQSSKTKAALAAFLFSADWQLRRFRAVRQDL